MKTPLVVGFAHIVKHLQWFPWGTEVGYLVIRHDTALETYHPEPGQALRKAGLEDFLNHSNPRKRQHAAELLELAFPSLSDEILALYYNSIEPDIAEAVRTATGG